LIAVDGVDLVEDFQVLRRELEGFSKNLAKKPFVVIFSKIDLVDQDFLASAVKNFEKKTKVHPLAISSATHAGITDFLRKISEKISVRESEDEEFVEFRPGKNPDPRRIEIEKTKFGWIVKNPRIEQISRQTDFENEQAKWRFFDVLEKKGVWSRLEFAGAIPGEKLKIGEWSGEVRSR